MMRRTLLAIVCSLAMALGSVPAGAGSAADQTMHLEVGGLDRTYGLYVPDGASPRGGFPVILAFHGGGGQGRGMSRLADLDALAGQKRFIAVYPDGLDRHWNDGRSTIKAPTDDVAFVRALLDDLARTYRVDPERIYATGISNGALFSQRLACDMSDRIAAIAPVAGTLPADLAYSCKPRRPVAVMQIGGTADPIMPFTGGGVADFGGRGEGGDVLSVPATADFWAQHDGCAGPGPSVSLPRTRLLDPTSVSEVIYSGCPATAPVIEITIAGGGHTWPGGYQYAPRFIIGPASRQFGASEAIVDFFLSLPPRS